MRKLRVITQYLILILSMQLTVLPMVEVQNFGLQTRLTATKPLVIQFDYFLIVAKAQSLTEFIFPSAHAQGNICTDSGRVSYNYSGVSVCLTTSQNTQVQNEVNACLAITSTIQRIQCLQGAEDKIYNIILDPNQSCNSPEKTSCESQADMVFNCMSNICLTVEQNNQARAEAENCKNKPTVAEKKSCVAGLQAQVDAYYLANQNQGGGTPGGTPTPTPAPVDPCLQQPAAQACMAKGMSWACDIALCLTPGEFLVYQGEMNKCQAVSGNIVEIVACKDVVNKNFRDFNSGQYNNCDTSSNPQAMNCKAAGQVWNCLGQVCLTQESNNNLNGEFEKCRVMKDPVQKDQCSQNAVSKIAEYKVLECIPTPAQISTCQSDNSKVWSCLANGCITQKEDELAKKEYDKCQSEPTPELQDACIQKFVGILKEYGGECQTAKTADKAACEAVGKVWNCKANYCLSKEYSDKLRADAVDCYLLPNESQIQACIDGLTDRTITDIANGSQCDEGGQKAKDCRAKQGHTWNCNVNFCLENSYNDALAAGTVTCYKKNTEAEKESCMNELKKKTARDIASGSLCDQTVKEYKDCSAKGMVWNCNLSFCVTKEYNDSLTDQTVVCYDKPTEFDQNQCLEKLKTDTIADIASGKLCDNTVPDAVACAAEGKVWNCQLNFCLPKDYNDKLSQKAIGCYTDKTPAETDQCMAMLKDETVTDIASGKLCDNSVPDAVACMAEGKIWNCNINFCLPKEYNDKLTTSTVACYQKTLQSEIDMCMEQVKSDTIADIAGGALCDKNTPQALDCQNSGKIWNCLINYCLTAEYNSSLTSSITDCYKKPSNVERDQCIAALKDKTVEDIAGGALCDKNSNEAKECESKPGYVYNCEVKFCLPKEYNDDLASKAKVCFTKTVEAEKQACMKDLKKTTALEIASGQLCDMTVPEAKACTDQGKVWNCNVNFCLAKDYNDKMAQDAALCYEKEVPSEIDSCMSDLKLKVVADISSGSQCDMTVAEAKTCQEEGKIWNCSVKLCVDEAFNKKIVDGSVSCYKLEDKVLIDKCMMELKSKLVAEVAGGALCDPNSPEAKACEEEGKIYNCHVKMCLPKSYNQQLAQKVAVCYEKPTQAEIDACVADVKKDTVREIAAGKLCDMNTPLAKECTDAGKIYNCNINFCVDKGYNDQVAEKTVACYDKATQAEIDDCMSKLKDETVADIASGALCDMNTPEAKSCAAEGKVYNCNISYCVDKEYNQKLSDKVVACYKEPNKEATDACMARVKDETIADIAGGANCNMTTPDAQACLAKDMVWNCEINYCVTAEYNQKLINGTKDCLARTTEEEKKACLDSLKDKTVKDVASGALCDETTAEAKSCAEKGMVFNCNVNYCLTEEYNNALAGKAANCYAMASKAETNACMKKLENDTAVDIAGGLLCKNDTPEAKSCINEGKVYNCNVEYCLTKEQNDQLAQELAACQTKPTAEEKDKCMKELEAKATEFVAGGGLCDPNTPEAKACTAQGKVYNCNINLCITEAENEVLTEEAVRCQNMPTEEEKESCIAELKQVGAAYLATNCDTEGNEAANQCKAEGKVWNCHANKCVTEEENKMLTRAILRCEGKTSPEDKQACYDEIREFEKLAQDQEGAVNIKDLEYKQKGGMGTAAALTVALAGVIAAAVAGCMSAAMLGVATLMAPNFENQTKDEAKTKMAQLKQEYAELEAKKGREGVSYEIQVEAFEFYLKALNTAAAIADKAAGNMSTLMGMFGVAMAMGAADIAIGFASCPACDWARIACGTIVMGLAGKGMSTTSKYKSIASNMAKEYRNRANVIKDVLDRFKKLFGPDGGLEDVMAKAEELKDRVEAKSKANEANEKSIAAAGGSSAGSSGGSTSSTNNKQQFDSPTSGSGNNPTSGSLNANSSDPAGGERTCLNSKGKVDPDCNCQKNKSCRQFKLPMMSAQSKKLHDDLETNSILKEVNDIASGKITVSHLNMNAIDKRNAKIRRIAYQLAKKSNDLLKKNGKKPVDLSDSALVKFINERISKKDLLAKQAELSAQYFGVPESKLTGKNSVISKSLSKNNSMPKIMNLAPLTAMRIIPRGFRPKFTDGEEEEKEDTTDSNMALSDSEMEYDYDNSTSQVIPKPEVSLWRIISNRYLHVRREKRIGRTKSASR